MAEARLPMRAVIVADPEISECEIDELHALGVRGVRLNLLFGAGLALATAHRIADKIRERGWHLQFLADVSQIESLGDLVRRLNIPVVFDHLGHVRATRPQETQGFRALLSLVQDSLAWVKISGGYRTTGRSDTPYDDLRPCVEALVNANPQQLVWGTDWPHPSIPVAMPDDTDLLEMSLDWISDEALAQQIFVKNPWRLYGFHGG
jgi:predicted TIM-barrel fold metal-dependent hydrolase